VRRRTAYDLQPFSVPTHHARRINQDAVTHKCVHQSRSGVVVQLSSHSFIVGLATHAAGAASYCERPSTVQCSDSPRAPYQSRCCDTQVCASIRMRRRGAIVVPLLHCRPRYGRRWCSVVLRTTFNRSVFRLTTRAASPWMRRRSAFVVPLSSRAPEVVSVDHEAARRAAGFSAAAGSRRSQGSLRQPRPSFVNTRLPSARGVLPTFTLRARLPLTPPPNHLLTSPNPAL
jgi:hypothetical protein